MGIVRGQEIIQCVDGGGVNRSSANCFDDYENYAPLPQDLDRLQWANSPYQLGGVGAPYPAGQVEAIAGGVPPAFGGGNILKALLTIADTKNLRYEIKEPDPGLGGVALDLEKWDVEVWFWHPYMGAPTVGEKFYFQLVGAPLIWGLEIDYAVPEYLYILPTGRVILPKAMPGTPTWIGFRIVSDGIFIRYYIWDPTIDTDWEFQALYPAGSGIIDRVIFNWENFSGGNRLYYADWLNIKTDIDYDDAATKWMEFEFSTPVIGTATNGRWGNVEFDQLNNEEGTDKGVRLDIYDVTLGAMAATDVVDSPTDLSKFVPAGNTIRVDVKFENSDEQSSPKLTKLQVDWYERPVLTVSNPPGAIAVGVGDVFLVEMSGVIGAAPGGQPAMADTEVTVTEFYIDWGDGTNTGWVTTSKIQHVYDSNLGGVLNLNAYCRDSEETVSAVVTRAITINDVAPVAVPRVYPIIGTTGITVINADQSESYEPNTNDAITQYEYDWDDGTIDTIGANTNTHIYATAGVYKTRHRCFDGALWSPYIEVYVIITDAEVPTDIDLRNLGGKVGLVDLKFNNVARMISENIINKGWVEYEGLDDRERVLSFSLKLPELFGQQERDRWNTYFEARTLLRIAWQDVDWAGNADIRYFIGRIVVMPLSINAGIGSEELEITMIREE